jgi:hypothetical protein
MGTSRELKNKAPSETRRNLIREKTNTRQHLPKEPGQLIFILPGEESREIRKKVPAIPASLNPCQSLFSWSRNQYFQLPLLFILEKMHSIDKTSPIIQILNEISLIDAGGLHDIGKLTVPPEILHKTEHLRNDELEAVRRHPLAGEVILMENHRYSQYADVVL